MLHTHPEVRTRMAILRPVIATTRPGRALDDSGAGSFYFPSRTERTLGRTPHAPSPLRSGRCACARCMRVRLAGDARPGSFGRAHARAHPGAHADALESEGGLRRR